jgi:signal transduction histidine kinase
MLRKLIRSPAVPAMLAALVPAMLAALVPAVADALGRGPGVDGDYPFYLATCALLAAIRISPIWLGVAVTAASAVGYQVNSPSAWSVSVYLYWLIPAFAAGCYVGAEGRRGWQVALPAAVAAAIVGPGHAWAYGLVLLPAAAYLLGVAVSQLSQDRARASALRKQLRVAKAEAAEAVDARLGLEERADLARELHDIVGHHLSAIALLTEAAAARPEMGASVLPRIGNSARAALGELDVLLLSLREPGTAPATDASPGLAELPQLLTPLESAGILGELQVDVRDQLPQGMQLAVFRIVQESVTNALRHARASTVGVRVVQAQERLLVDITDDGTGFDPAASPGRRGLVGIGERVSSYRGSWQIRPGADGGSHVHVDLPIPGQR